MWLMTLLWHKNTGHFFIYSPPLRVGSQQLKKKKKKNPTFLSKGCLEEGRQQTTSVYKRGQKKIYPKPSAPILEQGLHGRHPHPTPQPPLGSSPENGHWEGLSWWHRGEGGWFRWVEENGISRPRNPLSLPLPTRPGNLQTCPFSSAPNSLHKGPLVR